MESQTVLKVGGEQTPYFRTESFSKIMLQNEELIKKFAFAPQNSKAVFITGSGTAAMEASVMNVFTTNDKLLIINGGSFGQRFVDICRIHNIQFSEIKLEIGQQVTSEDLIQYNNQGYTGLLVNIHETSTGTLYDAELLSDFCKKNNMIFVADIISSFLADPFSMSDLGVDVAIIGSQKALACQPGISIILLSQKAVDRIYNSQVHSLYFDLKLALQNAERGQTPFTPAVNILLQINAQLKRIDSLGGTIATISQTKELATDFREKIANLPLEAVTNHPSNALTSLHPINVSAHTIFSLLESNYNIWVCPNGGDMKNSIFRVGHLGQLTFDDNTILVNALKDLHKKGLL